MNGVCVFINTELDVQNSSPFQKQNGVVLSEGPNCHKFNLIIGVGPPIEKRRREQQRGTRMKA